MWLLKNYKDERMKTLQIYFFTLITMMLSYSAFAQTTTNLGQNSGTLGSNNTNVGYYAGNSTVAGGNYNAFFGSLAGRYNTTGDYNSFFGYYAGTNTTGSYNIFLGGQSGRTNTTGTQNFFGGYASGYFNTTGRSNVFVGNYAGYRNTTASNNTFMGYYSGFNNTTGARNVYTGYFSGFGSTTGRNNSFYGYQSGRFNTTGYNNAFYGYYAGYRNTTGYDNSFFGLYAGYSTNTGIRNTFQGRSAGFSNTTGRHNVFSGYYTAYRNTTGSNNTSLGYYAGYNNQTGSRNVFIGSQAGYSETGSDKLYIDNSSTSTPLIYGDFATNDITINGGLAIKDGTQQAGYVLTSDANGNATWQAGGGSGGSDSDWTVSGSNMFSGVSGNVGIGNSSPAYKLDIKRNFRIDSESNPGRHYRVESTSRQNIYATNDMVTTTGGNQEYRVGSNRSFMIANNSSQKFFWAHGGSQKVSVGTVNTPTNVGGADISDYKLFVSGGILTEAVRVRVGWADYVFHEDYDLKPLNEVEEFIQEKGHLPNVPSATTVETQGLELGDITKIQQEKIEELFLHTIAQEKELKKQKEENQKLEERLAKLEALIKAIEAKK